MLAFYVINLRNLLALAYCMYYFFSCCPSGCLYIPIRSLYYSYVMLLFVESDDFVCSLYQLNKHSDSRLGMDETYVVPSCTFTDSARRELDAFAFEFTDTCRQVV